MSSWSTPSNVTEEEIDIIIRRLRKALTEGR